jgi:class 3 adenylate cyclase
MTFTEELASEIDEVYKTQWQERNGNVVPEAENVGLGNDAIRLDGTVLYADLADSSSLVKTFPAWYAAEVYKSFLVSACRIIRRNGGEITAFDGDRVMGVYLGDNKNTSAAKTALQLNHVVQEIINPKLNKKYPDKNYTLLHAVAVDTSRLFVARTGIRGSNDLVWVGTAANTAAKLCSLRDAGFASYITSNVFDAMHESAKNGGRPKQPMWESCVSQKFGINLYRSGWRWSPG